MLNYNIIKHRRVIMLFLVAFFLFGCYGHRGKLLNKNELSPEIKKIAEDISKYGIYTGKWVGYPYKSRSEQWDKFEILNDDAYDDELVILTEHSNVLVRCYAFLALANRNYKDLFPILIKHLSDISMMRCIEADIICSSRVGDFYFEVTKSKEDFSDAYKLNGKQSEIVDSILITNKNIILDSRRGLFYTIKPKKIFYERLKEIATIENNKNAFIALARFRKQEDIPLIINLLKDKDEWGEILGLWCVRIFPDSNFFSELCRIHSLEIKNNNSFNYSIIDELYKAIVQYKTRISRHLLEITLDEPVKMNNEYFRINRHRKAIWLALTKYPDKIYDGLIEQIHLSDFELEEMKIYLEAD